jgi:hypothetical protein
MIPKEVFLSHSSRNRTKARRLAEIMRKHGIPVWYSETNINGAQDWHEEIGRALKRCDWFIVLLSRNSVKSTWVKRELLYALNHKQYENHILPVVIGNCDPEELSWTIGMFQAIDMRVYNAASYQNLFQTWGVGYIP